AIMVLFGADLLRAARTGPKWKRMLVTASLSLMALLGIAPARTLAAEPTTAVEQTAQARALIPIGTNNLARSSQWKLILDTWRAAGALDTRRAAGAIVSSKGSTSAQRVEMKKKFTAAKQAIAELVSAGLLSAAEAGLLVIDADLIWERIIARPPIDSQKTCYKMAYFPPAKRSLKWLGKRLELVKKVAAANKIAPAALDKVMGNITGHLAILGNDAELKKLRNDADRQAAIKLRDEIAPLVVKIKRKVLALRLSRTSGWKAIDAALLASAPLAESHRSTSAQRVAVVEKIKIAKAAVASLAAAGCLAAGEAELMTGELARLKKEIFRDPPTDARVDCYDMMAPDPVGDSTKRLEKRIPLLKKLFESGKLNPMVAGKILPSVRRDIKLITNAKRAEALRKQAEVLLKQLEKSPSAVSTGKVVEGQ
ncbi:MAG: hypothetical protein GY794_17475, partial [bacterium]|nr:hypothetical protein [bacterium]